MPTWISRTAAALLSLTALAGCLDGTLPGFGQPAPQSLELPGLGITVAGPWGYCIDRGASRPGAEPAVVVLGSCRAISGDPTAAHPDTPGLLTATIASGPAVGIPPATMAEFFATERGRAVLARDGDAASVRLLRTEDEEGGLYLYLEDTGAGAIPGTGSRYWRGLFELNGHLVTLAVIPVIARPMSEATGLATLRGFRTEVVAATTAPEPDPEADAAAPGPSEGRGLGGLFGGLLR